MTLFLYTYPACPYCDRVRDFLAEKKIPYEEVNALPSTPGAKKLQFLGGKQQVPFLVDEARGVSMYESLDIIAYLEKFYG